MADQWAPLAIMLKNLIIKYADQLLEPDDDRQDTKKPMLPLDKSDEKPLDYQEAA